MSLVEDLRAMIASLQPGALRPALEDLKAQVEQLELLITALKK